MTKGDLRQFLNTGRNYVLKGASAIMIKKVSFAAVILAAFIGVMASQSYAVMYYVQVPEVRGLPQAQAESILKAKNYDIKIVEVPAENYSLVGKVMKQNPEPNLYFFVEKPKTFLVTLSVAGKGSFVPNMLGMTEAAAIDAVKKAGFTPKVEYYAEEIGGMVGKVKNSVPAPYINLAQGGAVTLRVGKVAYAMPNLIGNYAQGAKQVVDQLNSIKSLGLKLTVSEKITFTQQDDTKVFEQTPAPGSILTAGTEIKLSAYKYVAPTPLPPRPTPMGLMRGLVGNTEKDATDWLSTVGLKWSVNHVSAPQQNWGRVIAQSVPAGSRTAGPVVLTVGQK